MPISQYSPSKLETLVGAGQFGSQALVALTGTFTLTSQTLYANYLGQAGSTQSLRSLALYTTSSSVVTAAEVGLMSSPVGPNGSGQTLTCLAMATATTTIDDTADSHRYTLGANVIPAGTHLWAAVRSVHTALTLRPGYGGDFGMGACLRRASSAALVANTTYVMSTVTAATPATVVAPYLLVGI